MTPRRCAGAQPTTDAESPTGSSGTRHRGPFSGAWAGGGRLPLGEGAPAGPFSGVDRDPGRHAVDADAAEGHVGEVDAESDRVGPGELREEAGAQAGGLLVVEVEGVFPGRVGDLEGEWKASPKAITCCPPASMT